MLWLDKAWILGFSNVLEQVYVLPNLGKKQTII